MSPHRTFARDEADRQVPTGALPRPPGLGALLAATARQHPERLALADAPGERGWSARPAVSWTCAAATEGAARLAAELRGWRLPPESRVGLCMDGGTGTLLAFLAVEAAGHVPCLLPATWDEEHLLAAVQAAGISAVLTQSRLGPAAPAENLCRVAARYYGLRYLAAFGPDVPDGVIDLDAVAPGRAGGTAPGGAPGGLVSFVRGDPTRPVLRTGEALAAAIDGHLASGRVSPGERILSLMPFGGLPALVTGLGAALVSGASLEVLPLFEGRTFAAALGAPVPTHLVAPAFLEARLADHALPETLRSVSFVSRAPVHLPERPRPGGDRALRRGPVIDVLALDETAILTGARGTRGDLAVALAEPADGSAGLTWIRRDADGRLALRGRACAAMPLRRGIPISSPPEEWRPSRFAVTLSAGIASAVTAPADDDPEPDQRTA